MPGAPTQRADMPTAATDPDRLGNLFEELEGRGRRSTKAAGDAVGADTASAVLIRCSMARGPSERSLWPVEPACEVAIVPALGGMAWETDGETRVVTGGIASRVHGTDPRAVLVVGHTGCSVVATAHERVLSPDAELPTGLERRLAPLVSLVGDAVDRGLVGEPTQPRVARHRLVEYAVVRQVTFLAGQLSGRVTVAGYVHDEDGVYGSFPGRHYLVALDGETDPGTIRSRLPGAADVHVASLLP